MLASRVYCLPRMGRSFVTSADGAAMPPAADAWSWALASTLLAWLTLLATLSTMSPAFSLAASAAFWAFLAFFFSFSSCFFFLAAS